jgi:ribonuclease P protein subunit POP4
MLKSSHYCITADNLLVHELIGLKARVVKSPDKSRVGLKGKIVDETLNTFVLETAKGEKVLPKKEVWLEADLKGEKVEFDAARLAFRPEARTKMWRKVYA